MLYPKGVNVRSQKKPTQATLDHLLWLRGAPRLPKRTRKPSTILVRCDGPKHHRTRAAFGVVSMICPQCGSMAWATAASIKQADQQAAIVRKATAMMSSKRRAR